VERGARWSDIDASRAEDAVSCFRAAAGALDLISRHRRDRQAAIIAIGSGLSRRVPARVGAWRDVSAPDLAGEALARAAARPCVETVRWVEADIVARPDRLRDLWHDRAALHFPVAKQDRAGCRAALEAGTGPGSIVILSAFAPDGPERCSGLPVRRDGRPDSKASRGPGFAPRESLATDPVTPGGRRQRVRAHVARRIG
jgi:hypothetical protein